MGGTGPYSYDCSGLGWRAANDLGVPLARTVSQQLAQARAYPISELQAYNTPGALCIFYSKKTGLPRHVEYSTGKGKTVGSQISAGVGVFGWGWWKQGKQAELWDVKFYKHPALM
jgi:cell wall-associated NlpC family hydrolase